MSRQTEIVLLDGTKINIQIQPSLESRDLLDIVFSNLHIKVDKFYFGLFWIDSVNQYNHWLDLDRKVLDQELQTGKKLLLFFGVRYYGESFTCLAEDSSVLALFYQIVRNLHSKNLSIPIGQIFFEIYANILQALHGDFKENIFFDLPNDSKNEILALWKTYEGTSRGRAVVNTIQLTENLPAYGMHYFQVKDKQNVLHWLGVSHKGIGEFDYNDRTIVNKMFTWKQLENLYYRDKKFSIEVHDSKRMVLSKSSYNIYEESNHFPFPQHIGNSASYSSCDELTSAFSDPTTQVSTSRRTFSSGSVNVHAWFTNLTSLTKTIWQTAIEQHKHYLRPENYHANVLRSSEEVIRSLDRAKFMSATQYSKIIMSLENLSPEERCERKCDLEKRKSFLEDKLNKKIQELKENCLEEYQLTGVLPNEYPKIPGQPDPKLPRRVGASYHFSPKLLNDHADIVLDDLETKLEINRSVVAANERVYKEAKGTLRRKHKLTYKTSASELKKLEEKVNKLRIERGQEPVRKSKSIDDFSDDGSLDDLDDSPLPSPSFKREAVIKSSPRSSSPDQPVVVTYARYPAIKSTKSSETPRVEYVEMTSTGSRVQVDNNQIQSKLTTPNIPKLQNHNLPSLNVEPSNHVIGYTPFLASHRPTYRQNQYPTISQRYVEHVVEAPQYPIRLQSTNRPQHAALQQIEPNNLNEIKQLNNEYQLNQVCSSRYEKNKQVFINKYNDCVEVSKPFLSSDVERYSESKRRLNSSSSSTVNTPPLASPDSVTFLRNYNSPQLQFCENLRSPHSPPKFADFDISSQSDAFSSEMMNWLSDRNQKTKQDSTLV